MNKKKGAPSRRDFVKQTALAAGGMLAMPILSRADFFSGGAKDKIIECTDCAEEAFLPYKCNLDLTAPPHFTQFIVLDGTNALSYAKDPYVDPDKEYKDVSYNLEEAAGCEPGNTCVGDRSALKYFVYYPDPAYYPTLYTCTQLPPAMIYTHGGGFKECSNNADDKTDFMCRQFVQSGFIVFSIEYRRGRVIADSGIFNYLGGTYPGTTLYTTAQQALCYYRAFQDIRGAIRSIIQRNRDGQVYKFDENNIFLAGNSAGALMSINAAYYPTYPGTADPQPMIDAIDAGAHNYLGPVDQNYYYGDPSMEYQTKIKAILNCWGNGFIPKDKKTTPQDYFPAASKIPMISFHGYQDAVVYFADRPVFYPQPGTTSMPDPLHPNEEIEINPETRCLPDPPQTFTLPYLPPNAPQSWRFGSKDMFCFLKSVGVYTELYVDTSMHHGVNDITDNFGLPNVQTVDEIYAYIAQRGMCFFQAVLNKDTHPVFYSALLNQNNNKLFVDCVNTRIKCNLPNTNCPNPDPPGISCN